MEQKTLSRWLKLLILGVGVCGLFVYCLILPSYGCSLVESYPEFSGRYWPWLIFLWISGLPCYAVLFLSWKIAANIGADRSFSYENAKYLKWISWLAAGDSVFFFVGNLLLLLLDQSHPGVVLLSILVSFAGICVTVGAAALSHLVKKAAALQDENNLTI